MQKDFGAAYRHRVAAEMADSKYIQVTWHQIFLAQGHFRDASQPNLQLKAYSFFFPAVVPNTRYVSMLETPR